MSPRSVRTSCDRGSKGTFVKAGHRMGDQKTYYLELLRALEDTLSRWFPLYLLSLAFANPFS
jgi:hypothetical protein